MRISKHVMTLAAVALAAYLVGHLDLLQIGSTAQAQNAKENAPAAGQGEMDPAMAAWIKSGTPGEFHEYLKPLAGEFQGDVTMRMDRNGPWMKSSGTVKREWIFDGRYLQEHIDATGEMGPYKALAFMGYNNIDGQYEIVFMDLHSTAIMFETATYDPTTKILTTRSSMRDPASGLLMHGRGTLDLSNPDRHVYAGFTTGADGREYESFKGVMERTK